MARKTEFELEMIGGNLTDTKIRIVGGHPDCKPYVAIDLTDIQGYTHCLGIKDRDLERFAVNILKALGSEKLASNNNYRYTPYPNAEGQGVQ